MRFSLISAVVLSLVVSLSAPAVARAQDGPAHAFGLGLELGAPSGLAAKYYLGGSGGRGGMMALQAGLGVIQNWGPDGIHFHLEAVWHPVVLVQESAFTMPLYVGVGGRILSWNDDWCEYDNRGVRYCYGDGDTDIGVRAPIGILMDFHNVPLDVFFELALVVDLIHIDNGYDSDYYDRDYVGLNGALGVRYYF
jgi:hypothetical protein